MPGGYNITDQYHRIGVISICIIRLCMCLTRVAAPSCQSLKSCAPELAGRQSRAAYITWKVIGPYRSRQSCELDWCGLPLHSPLCDCCPQYAQPVIMSHMLTNFSNGHCPQIFVAVPDSSSSKFKYFIASYTRQSVHRGCCNKVSHAHTQGNLTKHNT